MQGMKIKRVAAPIRQQVVEMIRAAIVEGKYQPNERLIDAELCERFDVSRTVIRETIRQLEAEGLVDTIPHHGARVAMVSIKEARELYEVRVQLEALAGRGFALHASAEALQQLKDVLNRLSIAAEKQDWRALLAIKRDYYQVLLGNCGNRVVQSILEQLGNRIALLRATSLSEPGRMDATINEIKQIVEAIERGDADAAFEASRLHVEQSAANVLRIIEEREQEEAR